MNPLLLKGFNIRILIIILVKGKGCINPGSGLVIRVLGDLRLLVQTQGRVPQARVKTLFRLYIRVRSLRFRVWVSKP